MTRAKAVGLSTAFFVSGFAVSFSIIGAVIVALGQSPGLLEAAALQSAVMLPVFSGATWLFGLRLARLSPAELRWKGRLGQGVRGLAMGALPAVIVLVAALPLADARWMQDGGRVVDWIATLPRLVLVLFPAALYEELIFRGVPLVLLAGAFGRPVGLLVTALLFGLVHALNPEVTPLAIGNVALAGLFLGITFYLPGGLWTATGAHLGWNLTHAGLAAPVSGLPFEVPWLDYQPGGPDWLSGGSFGPEGGLLATLVLGLSAALAIRYVEPPNQESFA